MFAFLPFPSTRGPVSSARVARRFSFKLRARKARSIREELSYPVRSGTCRLSYLHVTGKLPKQRQEPTGARQRGRRERGGCIGVVSDRLSRWLVRRRRRRGSCWLCVASFCLLPACLPPDAQRTRAADGVTGQGVPAWRFLASFSPVAVLLVLFHTWAKYKYKLAR